MIAIVASLVIAIFLSGLTWLAVGSRFAFDPDEGSNDLLNLGAYMGCFFIVAIVATYALTRG